MTGQSIEENTTAATEEAAATETATQPPQDKGESLADTTEVDGNESAEEGGQNRPSNREARYRRQLRETEAERDALRIQVETMQRAEAERMAGSVLPKPAALWASGATLADLLDDDGQVDPGRVSAAATTAAETLGTARVPRTPRPNLAQGVANDPVEGSKWEAAFTPK